MLDKNLRRRLSRLLQPGARQSAPAPADAEGEASASKKATAGEVSPPLDCTVVAPPELSEDVESVLEAFEGRRLETSSGALSVVEGLGKQVLDSNRGELPDLAALAERPGLPEDLERLGKAAREGPVLCFDLETCGLSNAPVFLAGILEYSGGAWRMRQYLAEDLDEEAALLEAVRAEFERASAVVSYNGRTFDLPFLRLRAAFHLMELPEDLLHVDLLPLARRKYRRRLPDCKLQTLETWLLRRRRAGDVPGPLIGRTYYRFAESSDPALIVPVLAHNAWDLLALAQYIELLCEDEG